MEPELARQRIERCGLSVRKAVAALDHHALLVPELRQPLAQQRFDLVSRKRRLGRRRILRGVFTSLGRQLAEFCRFPSYTRENVARVAVYEGFENYAAARQRGGTNARQPNANSSAHGAMAGNR